MQNLSLYASQIIAAAIIATLIEIILPRGNNKKYIKIVLNIYIIFTMLSPIVTNAFEDNLSKNLKDYGENLLQTEEYKTLSKKFEDSKEISLEKTYITAIKDDIKTKLKAKGYTVTSLNIEILSNSEDIYGEIAKIDISLNKGTSQEDKKEQININKVSIGKEEKIKSTDLSVEDKFEITQFLNSEYGVNINNINIK